ncbi:MAG: RNA polymerase sigma factor [Proteobacteria bacterium]|jgi:RNA polymerase sigma-70 factor (ECF subfamily)|nr:RNA polymerase sigma factor [Pseudomonadota bacterium]
MKNKVDVLVNDYLVLAAKAGDRTAFGRLVELWHPKLVAHAWRLLGNGDDAQDAAQEAWVEIAKGLGRLVEVRAFPAWAFRIVTRRCGRIVGKLALARKLERAILAKPESVAEPDPATDASDAQALSRAIRKLSPDQRATVALHYFEDMSVAQVAVALDVPVGTVKTRLMHARANLRVALEGERQ